jgi:hypothetical protein
MIDARPEIDWDLMDQIIMPDEEASMWDYDDSLTAAGESPSDNDGNYTPEERSANAGAQLRDKTGKFAKMGGRVVIGGRPNYQGNIRSIDNATGNVKVELDNGNMIDVNAKLTEPLDTYTPIPQGFAEGELDTNGILGEPRTPMDSPIRMPGTLPPLNAASLNSMLTNYPQWVADQRLSADTAESTGTGAGTTTTPAGTQTAPARSANPLAKYYPQVSGAPEKSINAYNIPVLKKYLEGDRNGLRTANPFFDPADTKRYIEPKGAKNRWLDKILKEKLQDENEYNDVWSSIIANDGSVQHLDILDEATKDVFKTSMEIDQRWVIDLASDRQAYIDQAQSLNLFFRPDVHIKYIHAIHFMAWKKGLKTLYYCRSEKIGKADKVSKRIEREVIKELDMTQIAQGNDCIACEG